MSKSCEIGQAKELMSMMVENSQRPDTGNLDFVEKVNDYLQDFDCETRTVSDPEFDDRKLLIADFGDPDGQQIFSVINHSDVVGVNALEWNTDPWKLHEENGEWFGRGVCDTHGSGVSMLLALNSIDLIRELRNNKQKMSLIFTYDEETPEQKMNFRGIKLAVGQLGVASVVDSKYFVVGEPTEIKGKMRAMIAQKGRWLATYRTEVENPGHVSARVQNALTLAMRIGSEIDTYAKNLQLGREEDVDAQLFNPPYSTIQISAGEIKSSDYSSTPKSASFSVDMRTLPLDNVHNERVWGMTDLILHRVQLQKGEKVFLEVLSNKPGTFTDINSPIVKIAENVTRMKSVGFNGGEEGQTLRNAGHEGITMGPGDLKMAHRPNESIKIQSVMGAIEKYELLYKAMIKLKERE